MIPWKMMDDELQRAIDAMRPIPSDEDSDREKAIAELVELAQEMLPYVPEYFRKKWEMEERLGGLEWRIFRAQEVR